MEELIEENIENEEQNLKDFAAEILLKSSSEISNDKQILEKLKDKVIIISESKKIEVIFKTNILQDKMLLYLTGKLMGFKILKIFESPLVTTNELSENLNLSPKALARPLGILTGTFIDKEQKGYKIRAYKIMEFLDSLDSPKKQKILNKNFIRGKSSSALGKISGKTKVSLKKEGVKELINFLEIPEGVLRSAIFFRENEPTIINSKLIQGSNSLEKQLNVGLIYLLAYKYGYGLINVPASTLRNKLKKNNVPSLVNLSSNLHRFSEFILHEAGPKGSQKNYYILTPPGEEEVKHRIRIFLRKNLENQDVPEEENNDDVHGNLEVDLSNAEEK